MFQKAVHKDMIFKTLSATENKVTDKKIVVNVNQSVLGSLRKKKNISRMAKKKKKKKMVGRQEYSKPTIFKVSLTYSGNAKIPKSCTVTQGAS